MIDGKALASARDVSLLAMASTYRRLPRLASADGAGGRNVTYGPAGPATPCSIRPLSGDEAERAGKLTSEQMFQVSLPHDAPSPAAHDRCEVDGQTYEIVEVRSPRTLPLVTLLIIVRRVL